MQVCSENKGAGHRALVTCRLVVMEEQGQPKSAGRYPCDQERQRADALSVASSQSAAASQPFPLFTPVRSMCSPPQQTSQQAPSASVPLQHSLSPSKRPREEGCNELEQAHQPTAVPQDVLMSHPLSVLAPHTSPPAHQSVTPPTAPLQQQQRQLTAQWLPVAGQTGLIPQGLVPVGPSSGLWALPQAASSLGTAGHALPQDLLRPTGVAEQVTRSIGTAATGASTSAQRQQTALNVDRALLNHLQLVHFPFICSQTVHVFDCMFYALLAVFSVHRLQQCVLATFRSVFCSSLQTRTKPVVVIEKYC